MTACPSIYENTRVRGYVNPKASIQGRIERVHLLNTLQQSAIDFVDFIYCNYAHSYLSFTRNVVSSIGNKATSDSVSYYPCKVKYGDLNFGSFSFLLQRH